jgi:hypothetical protein
MEALSPNKKINSMPNDTFQSRNERYNSFARNYSKEDNDLSKSHNTNSLRRKLSDAGGSIMNNRMDMSKEYPKINSSHTNVPNPLMNNSGHGFNNMKSPSSSKNNPSPYLDMKNSPEALKEFHKNSFNTAKKMDSVLNARMSDKKLPMPYRNNFSNGEDFSNTAVSTPVYNNVPRFRSSDQFSNDKQQINHDLTILRRSMQRNQFSQIQDQSMIQKRNSDAGINRRIDMSFSKTMPK